MVAPTFAHRKVIIEMKIKKWLWNSNSRTENGVKNNRKEERWEKQAEWGQTGDARFFFVAKYCV